ncbi:MAG: adenine-specific methyltransferase EcoRI family protein [Nitrosopumilus sp.]|nr:adenine-specific methyltransferase EcoRI family protein [Nitrosopumilus sp.]
MISKNSSLNKAKTAKDDEFYTQLTDIEHELKHYQKHFKGKRILCNCDDPRISGFFHYFSYNFEKLKLKKLTTTCYRNQQMNLFSRNNSKHAVWLEYNGDKNNNRIPDLNEIGLYHLNGDGDFRSKECIKILEQSDIVVTNPPFSLFREYVSQLIKYNKKFLIIGNQNAAISKEIFSLIRNNKLWYGYHVGGMAFKVPDHYEAKKTGYWQDKDGQKWRKLGNTCWFTNLDIKKRHEPLICHKKYDSKMYLQYDNFDAIEIGKIVNIPYDYSGLMGVPLTFISQHNPDQFEIIGSDIDLLKQQNDTRGRFYVNGKRKYARIVIKNKRLKRPHKKRSGETS